MYISPFHSDLIYFPSTIKQVDKYPVLARRQNEFLAQNFENKKRERVVYIHIVCQIMNGKNALVEPKNA